MAETTPTDDLDVEAYEEVYDFDPSVAYEALEEFCADREPFTFEDEDYRQTSAAFDGDIGECALWGRSDRRKQELDEEFWTANGVTRLARADLQALRDLDASFNCSMDDADEDFLESVAWGEFQRLGAIGRRLYKLDPTFWRQLRLLGATPTLLRVANGLLFPAMVERSSSHHALNARFHIRERRTRARSRGRRSAPSRQRVTSRSAGGGSSDPHLGGDDPPGEPRQVVLESSARVGVVA